MLNDLLYHPRRLWLRRVFFQIHLWLGLFIALYVVVIAVSGSVLVFQAEIRQALLPHAEFDATRIAPVSVVAAAARTHFSEQRLTYIAFPQQPSPWWTLYLENAQGKTHLVYADAATGQPLPLTRTLFVDWVEDLHIYLLAGRTGFIVNCVMGISLLLVALTGAVLWWPGIRHCMRSLQVRVRHGWKRANYDLHQAVGIWTLLIVCWWGFTAVYFLCPAQVTALVSLFSQPVGMKPPTAQMETSGTGSVSLDALVALSQRVSPGYLSGVSLPDKTGGNVTVLIDRRHPGDFSHRDILVFSGHTGKLLSNWHYGEKYTLADWILWLVHPLHFGTLWGLPVKILWACCGIGLASLSVSGVLMYWNRFLSRKVRAR